MLSPHFALRELACKCVKCAGNTPADEFDPYLLDVLEGLRRAYGPIIVNSGFRCPKHNADVGGSPTSQHLLGRAADIVPKLHRDPETFDAIADVAEAIGATGIGVYEWGIHVDVRLLPPGEAAHRWRGPGAPEEKKR